MLDVPDNCPLVANAGQSDFDNNGVGDACDPVRWYLQNITFSDGGTAFGSFDFALGGGYSNIDITTTPGSNSSGFTYGDPLPVSPGNESVIITVPDASLSDLTGQPVLSMIFTDFLSPAGGVSTINLPGGFSFERQCVTEDCIFASIVRTVTGGSVSTTPGGDTNMDGIADTIDNCQFVANPSQADGDGDGYGNLCDADLNNDCIVNAQDLGAFRTVFFTTNADADLNSDGIVNAQDLGLFRTLFFTVPGPSGLTSQCL